MIEQNEVLGFIYRRFPYTDNGWNDYNTYYFAYVLKARFPQTIIYYDKVYKIFFAYIDGIAYNHHGVMFGYDKNTLSKFCIDYDTIMSAQETYNKELALLKEKILREHIL